MKIDLSTIFIVIMVVIPGLFAQRSQDLLAPRPLRTKGASEELAELAALGMATHGVLACLAAVVLVLMGLGTGDGGAHFFRVLDTWQWAAWSNAHSGEAILLSAAYIFLSFFLSHCLGLIYGVFSLEGRVTARILGRTGWQQSLGVRGSLEVGERPFYDLLKPERNEQGTLCVVFVEAELKGNLGLYSGQLDQFAIVRDEEAHRPIYLIDPWYKVTRDALYAQVPADGIRLDLIDVATLLLRQVDPSEPLAQEVA